MQSAIGRAASTGMFIHFRLFSIPQQCLERRAVFRQLQQSNWKTMRTFLNPSTLSCAHQFDPDRQWNPEAVVKLAEERWHEVRRYLFRKHHDGFSL